jgi:hypothetical protein
MKQLTLLIRNAEVVESIFHHTLYILLQPDEIK